MSSRPMMQQQTKMPYQLRDFEDGPDGYEIGGFRRPPELSGQEKFQRFFYNRDEGTVLGRGGRSWAKIGLFYFIFYTCLAALFAICLWVFYQTLDPRIPRWTQSSSLIGTSPGLGFRPMPPEENVESTLIWYKGTQKVNFQHWTDSLDKFLEVYKTPGLTPGRGQNIYNCDYDKPPGPGQVCDVDIKTWDPCTHENMYNYHKAAPCIFVKLNKIYGWVPEYYNDTNDLPEEMPEDLKDHIRSITVPEKRNTVWISCEGENPADIENIGPLKYIPDRGFPGYFYPYENSEGYLSPLVAINFERPKGGILINIECKAWAKNIKHNRQYRIGMVHLELMID
ncbi:sodium/potassium-transporting ATPase subunit beta-2-like isoform X1 [Schistocerca piceifrons]|uniref:sodium/potassium-transporting ATPase subunit beta-2-like isoform X1 n=1 Tax=Schistocerca piceifrons TaxID=274613 RepID=UPI001F5EDF2A|nr:sodium/potassium-transporting ATPase subunit beta-2-like isoform X1 [Schistocerca piceifrons]